MKLVNGKTFSEVFLSAEGRLSNQEYMLYLASGCIVYLLLLQVLKYVPQDATGISTFGLATFWLVCRIFLGIKRCHDLGHSGNWLFWYLCPIFNLIFPFILFFKKGDDTDNKYGKTPLSIGKSLKITTIILIIVWWVSAGYVWYNTISDIQTRLSEISEQMNQIEYEALTKEELSEFYGNDKLEEFSNYRIPKSMLEQDSDLIELIVGSTSLGTTQEKQERFDLYSLMNEDQKEKLRDILNKEKEKLAEIEAKYQIETNTEESLNDDMISE